MGRCCINPETGRPYIITPIVGPIDLWFPNERMMVSTSSSVISYLVLYFDSKLGLPSMNRGTFRSAVLTRGNYRSLKRLRFTGEGQREDEDKWQSIRLGWLDKDCPHFEKIEDILNRYITIPVQLRSGWLI
jgi:hypothetical protein